jgi:hypothetical protein
VTLISATLLLITLALARLCRLQHQSHLAFRAKLDKLESLLGAIPKPREGVDNVIFLRDRVVGQFDREDQ